MDFMFVEQSRRKPGYDQMTEKNELWRLCIEKGVFEDCLSVKDMWYLVAIQL